MKKETKATINTIVGLTVIIVFLVWFGSLCFLSSKVKDRYEKTDYLMNRGAKDYSVANTRVITCTINGERQVFLRWKGWGGDYGYMRIFPENEPENEPTKKE